MSLPGWLKETVRPFYLRWLYFPLYPRQQPQSFVDCWRFPYRFTSDPLARLTPNESHLPDLLFFPMTDWHSRTQRTQHLVRAFARLGYRCIFINPHLGREFEKPRLFDREHRFSRIEENVFELHVRLPREPVYHDRLLTQTEETIITDALQSVLPERARVIQVLSFPSWAGVARQLRSRSGFPIVYDCHDFLPGFQNIVSEVVAEETPLLKCSDLVLFSSQGLADRYSAGVKRWLLVRNAVTVSQFDGVPEQVGVMTAGYLGALDSWFDVEAVSCAARENPDCRFLIAGNVEHAPVKRLAEISNIQFLGEIPYHRVPELLGRFRIALIPFLLTPLTLMTNPVKLYEYFGCGLPVVSTALPEAQSMGDLVYIASTPQEFGRQVKSALHEDDAGRRARRRQIAATESWEERAKMIAAKFPQLC